MAGVFEEVWAVAVGTADPQGEQAFAAAHRALLARRDLQFDFPAYVEPRRPEWLRGLAEFLSAVLPYLKYVFWGGLALGAALMLFLVGRELIRTRWPKRVHARNEAALERPDAATSGELLAEADRLAAEGKYDEAAHLLLFRTILDLSERQPTLVRPSLTSRDIAAIQAMPGRARSRFAEIAEVVERSFFAGRPIGAREFADCRSAYSAFVAADAWT